MLVLLAAIDEGLAAGVFGLGDDGLHEVRKLLGLPDDVAVVEVITLGYPGRTPLPIACPAAARIRASRSTSSFAGKPGLGRPDLRDELLLVVAWIFA